MKSQYEFPDDPEVFEWVLEHFRQTSVDHWEARIAQYASEAENQSPKPKRTLSGSEPSKKRASKNVSATVKLP